MTTTPQTAAPRQKTIGQAETPEEARTPAQLIRFYGKDDLQDFRHCMQGYPGGAAKIPDPDVALFVWRCKATGLDPFQGHIVGIYRKDDQAEGGVKLSIQTEVAGYRVAAFRSGELIDVTEPVFDREPDDKPPLWARVIVKRIGPKGNEMSFAYTAHYREFLRNGPVWKSMPWHMLGLRAEGHALKKAFPDILAGIDLGGRDGDDDGDRPVYVASDTAPVRKPELGAGPTPDPEPAPAPAKPARSIPPAVKPGATGGA